MPGLGRDAPWFVQEKCTNFQFLCLFSRQLKIQFRILSIHDHSNDAAASPGLSLILTKASMERLEEARPRWWNGSPWRGCSLGLAACSKSHVLISSRKIVTTAVGQTDDYLEHVVVHQLLGSVLVYVTV